MGRRLSPMLERPVDFNVIEYKFIDMFQNTICNNFSETTTYQILRRIKYPQLSEKAFKILLFTTTCLHEARFSSYTSSRATYHNRLNIKSV